MPPERREIYSLNGDKREAAWGRIAIEVNDLLSNDRTAPRPGARLPQPSHADSLYKIDFALVETITDPIVKRLKSRDENAAIFLLPAAKHFVGDYWSRRLLERQDYEQRG